MSRPPVLAPTQPASIDRYEVVRLLGEGAMGRVYLCHDPKLQRQVAVKVLLSAIENAEMRERFRLEVRAVSALKHANIIELYDFSGEDAQLLYFVMEYVPGRSLYETLRTSGPMPEEMALCVAHELAVALAHAHERHVVHRDIKPENVLLHDGRLVLTDFGIVKAVAETNALGVRWPRSRTRVVGTPGFMAPEQFAGDKIDYRTDLFAVGALLYNLTTDHVPYEGSTAEALYKNLKRGRYKDPRHFRRELSAAFCAVVARCTALKPSARFASADVLRQVVRDLLSERGVNDIRDALRAYARAPQTYRPAGVDAAAVDALVAQLREQLVSTPGAASAVVLARLENAQRQWVASKSRFWLGLACGTVLGALLAVAARTLVRLAGGD